MKVYRFMTEYANYINRRFLNTDMPQEQKKRYCNDIALVVRRAEQGLITLNEGMALLVRCEQWLNNYIN